MSKTNSVSVPSLSIVLAEYRGDRYLRQQLESIITQMSDQDELIVSCDDGRSAGFRIARAIQESHPHLCIHVLEGPGKGAVSNFEFLLNRARHEVIVLSDQDDVWKEGKLALIRKTFTDPQIMALVHDASICSENLEVVEPSFYKAHHTKEGFAANLIRNSFIGCCMAFRKEVAETSLPFETIPMHDQLLGLVASLMGKVVFSNENLLLYRRHEDNASSLHPSSLIQQLIWRTQITKALLKKWPRIMAARKRMNSSEGGAG